MKCLTAIQVPKAQWIYLSILTSSQISSTVDQKPWSLDDTLRNNDADTNSHCSVKDAEVHREETINQKHSFLAGELG